jgi:hypothetical protein
LRDNDNTISSIGYHTSGAVVNLHDTSMGG